MLKKFVRGAGVLALSGGLVASGALIAAPAQAAPAAAAAVSVSAAAKPVVVAKPIRVSAVVTDGDYYKGRVIPVSSKGCKSLAVSIRYSDAPGVYTSSFQFSYDLYRGSKKVRSVTLKPYSTYSTQSICLKKSATRYGTYQVKNVRVKGWYNLKDTNGNTYYDSNYNAVRKNFNYAVGTKSKTFAYRGRIDGSLAAKRAYRSSKVTFTAKTKFFSDKYQKWVAYNPKGAKIQVKSGSKWKTVKTLKLKKGKAVYSLRNSKKKTYRLYVPAKSYAFGGYTNGFKI